MECDFSGYASKSGLRCSDGRTILPDAFKHQDGQRVPLVWQHSRNDPKNVLGHAVLENRPDGMYAYCNFNGSPDALAAKVLVQHEDVNALSIYANQLIEKTKNVVHGMIREVSLVIAGANPGALIDNIVVQHGDMEDELSDEAIIYTGLTLEHSALVSQEEKEETVANAVIHADSGTDEETLTDIFETLDDKQKELFYYAVSNAMQHSDSSDYAGELADSEEDKAGESEDEEDSSEDVKNSDNESENIQHSQEGELVHNIFENNGESAVDTKTHELTHADVESIFKDAKAMGSIKDAVMGYALQHGIENIDTLFPDAKAISTTPDFISRRMEWVDAFMTGTNHTPFSRIKTMTADITVEEARAKGYIKGNRKTEEFFGVAKRVTTPQTVYKKQQLDRDDILDITDFDVVAWLRGEMRIMLEEEIARAGLMGDGRSNADNDKIKETNIRPIATDDELFQTTVYVNIDDTDSSAEEIIDALTLQRRHYRGSGNPTFFTSETMLSKMLLIKDTTKRRVYQSVADLCVALRCKDIVTVEAMEDAGDLLGILVNLADYTIGADKGGDVSMFDDFDIDFNQYKYLIETRISGALTKPKSALVVRKVASTATLVVPVEPTFASNAVTVATTTGVTYKNKNTGTTLTHAAPVTLVSGDVLTVIAVPASSSYYFATSADDEWTFEYQA